MRAYVYVHAYAYSSKIYASHASSYTFTCVYAYAQQYILTHVYENTLIVFMHNIMSFLKLIPAKSAKFSHLKVCTCMCDSSHFLPHPQAKDQVMVTHEDAEKLTVTMADFEHALTYDIKPAFGISDEQLDSYVFNGEVEIYPACS